MIREKYLKGLKNVGHMADMGYMNHLYSAEAYEVLKDNNIDFQWESRRMFNISGLRMFYHNVTTDYPVLDTNPGILNSMGICNMPYKERISWAMNRASLLRLVVEDRKYGRTFKL